MISKRVEIVTFPNFFSAALKELPDDPAALKRAAKNKRKQKEAATDESGTSVRSMMTGVTIYNYDADAAYITMIYHSFFPELSIH